MQPKAITAAPGVNRNTLKAYDEIIVLLERSSTTLLTSQHPAPTIEVALRRLREIERTHKM
jgi:hypothetical protein